MNFVIPKSLHYHFDSILLAWGILFFLGRLWKERNNNNNDNYKNNNFIDAYWKKTK